MKKFLYILILTAMSANVFSQSKFDYAGQWKKVQTLLEGVLPKSALPEIEKIKQQAATDKEYGHFLKSLNTRNRCMMMVSDMADLAVIEALQKDLQIEDAICKAVVNSLLAESYKNYNSRTAWKRNNTTDLEVEDFSRPLEEWSSRQLLAKSLEHYEASLSNFELLSTTKIDVFQAAIEGGKEARYLRPTLFDHLAQAFLSAVQSFDFQLFDKTILPALSEENLFASDEEFAAIELPNPETPNVAHIALRLLQDLTKLHLKRQDLNALSDVCLTRLQFLQKQHSSPNAPKLYQKRLEEMLPKLVKEKVYGKVAFALVLDYQSKKQLLKAIKLAKEIAANSPEYKTQAQQLIENITAPELSLTCEKYLLSEQHSLAKINFKNITKAFINVYSHNETQWEKLLQSEYKTEDIKRFLSKQKLTTSQTINLPKTEDFLAHSAEIALNPLALGGYLLVISDTENPAKSNAKILAYHEIRTTELKVLQRSLLPEIEISVLNAKTGKPIENARIIPSERSYDRSRSRFVFTDLEPIFTDENGVAILKTQINNYVELRVEKDEDKITVPKIYSYEKPENQRNNTAWFTDRAIYRPGQIVHFKAILYHSNNGEELSALKNKSTKVQFLDANRREISSQMLTTNEFGSVFGTFTIPQNLLNGLFMIRNEFGSQMIRVEEYRRPTFEILVLPLRDSYKFGQNVEISAMAQALAGYPIDNAEVKFSVTRQKEERVFSYLYTPRVSDSRKVFSSKTMTENDGSFKISFPALAEDILPSDNSIYIYKVEIAVTAADGETRTSNASVRISRNPLRLFAGIPEKISVEENTNFKFAVRTQNLNGDNLKSQISAEVFPLEQDERLLRNRLWNAPDTCILSKEEFVKIFPYDRFMNSEDIHNARLGDLLFAKKISSEKNEDSTLDLSELKDAPSGYYLVKLHAQTDKDSISHQVYVYLQQPNSKIQKIEDFVVAQNQVCNVLDTAKFLIAGPDSAILRYDILLKDKSIKTEYVQLSTTQKQLQIPVSEEYKGGFAVAFAMIHGNREYTSLHEIAVPYLDKKIEFEYASFRTQLLPSEHSSFSLKVKNLGKDAAEMVATLYDASLDLFVPHHFRNPFSFTARSHYAFAWQNPARKLSDLNTLISPDLKYISPISTKYEKLFGEQFLHDFLETGLVKRKTFNAGMAKETAMMMDESAPNDALGAVEEEAADVEESTNEAEERSDFYDSKIPLRSNFNETAFFYPAMKTDENGEIRFEFTIPDALTKWNFLAFAHDKNFAAGLTSASLITQKPLSISANFPRFLRAGDKLIITARIQNLSEKSLAGTAQLKLFDALSLKPIDSRFKSSRNPVKFSAEAKQNSTLSWEISVPNDCQAITYQITAEAENFSDGEERSVPVLTNRILLSETLPFILRPNQRQEYALQPLVNCDSKTLQHHKLSLEYTANPAWTALQALPQLMEFPNECSEQTAARIYSNALASHIMNASPNVKKVLEQWQNFTPDALLSNLEKNQDLKYALLQETPWVMQANNETERKRQLATLLDLNKMANDLNTAIEKLLAQQSSNGGFAWFKGMPQPDAYITQQIVIYMEHLRRLGALPKNQKLASAIAKALNFNDEKIAEIYQKLSKLDKNQLQKNHLSPLAINYLFASSFSAHKPSSKTARTAFDFFLAQAEKYWSKLSLQEQALVALSLHRYGKTSTAQAILRSLKERAATSAEIGMYWDENQRGYAWYQAPIETQSLLIEAFSEIGADTKAVDEMRIHLLCLKQTTDWGSSAATTAAVYALLSGEQSWSQPADNAPEILIAKKALKKMTSENLTPEPGTSHLRVDWNADKIKPEMGNLRVTNNASNVILGALHWQFFEDMDKVSVQNPDTKLAIKKEFFLKDDAQNGKVLRPITPENLKIGDVLTVRLILTADRDYEYVHLKDHRPAGTEPVSAISAYKFQNSLGYYEAIKDASTNFFISYLPKGSYVFEYDLRISHSGEYSSGLSTFQCMYAPEFTSHSSGSRIKFNR